MKEQDELEAGPELNRLVCNAVGIEGYQLEYGKVYPNVSGSVECAMLLIDWWRNPDRDGGYGEMNMRCEGSPDEGCWVVNLGVVAQAQAKTLPLAISRAFRAFMRRQSNDAACAASDANETMEGE